MSDKSAPESRRVTNPLYNDRKLKLGTFSTNLAFAGAATTVPGTHTADWPSVMALAQMANEMEFEAIVPVARWCGFDGILLTWSLFEDDMGQFMEEIYPLIEQAGLR